jgi:hypothetical protein
LQGLRQQHIDSILNLPKLSVNALLRIALGKTLNHAIKVFLVDTQ